MEWQSILIIALAIFLGLLTNKWWLPSLIAAFQGKRIIAKWAGKEYGLTIEEAEEVISKQQTAILDDSSGVVANLMNLPNVTGVELAPRIVAGKAAPSDLVLRVKVRQKLPRFEISAGGEIPRSVGGIPTDVVEEED